jgi:para-aminobenzoate synthetase component I
LTTEIFAVTDQNIFRNKMLNWATRFNIFCFLDNNGYHFDKPSFDCVLAAGCRRSVKTEPGNAFASLKEFYNSHPSWLFGHLGYGLKDETEALSTTHKDLIDFGIGFFFEPEILIRLNGNQVTISSAEENIKNIFSSLQKSSAETNTALSPQLNITAAISQDQYINTVHALQHHIKRGDCYEVNFCQQFFAKEAVISPLDTYRRLVELSPNPFSAFYKLNDLYCLCASPERYLKKSGSTIFSQPIKGTSRRNYTNTVTDEKNKKHLLTSKKERSENVMIVDLVRNDLSRICKEGSVIVEELFGIYSFPQVHQMISTVKGELADDLHWVDAVKATFPMGSMTGAPKKRVMELIDEYETTSRGLFSGSIGYVTPEANFDFNVVIRSIFYDAQKKNLSFSAGGGITFGSNAEEEYSESLLKAETIRAVLSGS